MALGAIALGGASILGGILGGGAASAAAKEQAQAANNAASLQYLLGNKSLGFQQQVYNNNQTQESPYQQAGYGGLANLSYLLGVSPGGSYPTGPATAGGMQMGGPSSGQPGSAYSVPGMTGPPQPGIPGMTPSMYPSGGPGVFGQLWTALGKKAGATPSTGFADAVNQYSGSPAMASTGQVPGGGAGTAPLSSLVNPSLGGFGSLSSAYPGGPWQMPTGQQALDQDPGYQFRMSQGLNALSNSASARGTLLNGSTSADILKYGQDYASNEYQNAYNRSQNNYLTNFNAWNTNSTNQYNRLAALAGVGQTSTQQLGQQGLQSAGMMGSTLSGLAGNMGQQYNNAAAANASGYVGRANAIGQGISGGLASLAGYLNNRPQAGAPPSVPYGQDNYYGIGS